MCASTCTQPWPAAHTHTALGSATRTAPPSHTHTALATHTHTQPHSANHRKPRSARHTQPRQTSHTHTSLSGNMHTAKSSHTHTALDSKIITAPESDTQTATLHAYNVDWPRARAHSPGLQHTHNPVSHKHWHIAQAGYNAHSPMYSYGQPQQHSPCRPQTQTHCGRLVGQQSTHRTGQSNTQSASHSRVQEGTGGERGVTINVTNITSMRLPRRSTLRSNCCFTILNNPRACSGAAKPSLILSSKNVFFVLLNAVSILCRSFIGPLKAAMIAIDS